MSMGYEIGLILAYGFGIVLLYLVGYLLLAPLRVLGKFLINSILGGAALLLINFFGGFLSFHLPINVFSTIIVGFLGVPGVTLLFFIEKMA